MALQAHAMEPDDVLDLRCKDSTSGVTTKKKGVSVDAKTHKDRERDERDRNGSLEAHPWCEPREEPPERDGARQLQEPSREPARKNHEREPTQTVLHVSKCKGWCIKERPLCPRR